MFPLHPAALYHYLQGAAVQALSEALLQVCGQLPALCREELSVTDSSKN